DGVRRLRAGRICALAADRAGRGRRAAVASFASPPSARTRAAFARFCGDERRRGSEAPHNGAHRAASSRPDTQRESSQSLMVGGRTTSPVRLLVRLKAKQIETVLVHTAKVAAPQRYAVAVEEFEDLDRDLAAIIETVAEQRGGELAVCALGCDLAGDLHHLADRGAQKEVIVRDLVDVSHAAKELHQPPQLAFANAHDTREVAYPRWP